MAENKTPDKKNADNKVSFKELWTTVKKRRILATYNVGTIGGGPFGNFTKAMRQIYFVQTMGLSNAAYASATVIGNIVNGFTNPVIGFLMDKRIFKRKYTPWILVGALGSVGSYAILYFIPWTPIVNSTTVAWTTAMLMVVLVGFFHAVGNINRGAVFSALTMKGRERVIAKVLGGYVGGLGKVLGKVIFPLVLAWAYDTFGDAKAYFPTAIILGAILILFSLWKIYEVRKFIPGDIEGITIDEATGKHTADEQIPAKEMITNLFTNLPLFALILNSFINMTKRTFTSPFRTMYFKYVAGDIRWMSVQAGLGTLVSPAFKVLRPILAIWVGDAKWIAIIGRCGNAAVAFLSAIFGHNIWAFIIIRVSNGFFNAFGGLATSILKAGAVDYGELKNGVRHPGMIMALSGVGSNAGQAIGTIIRAYFLERIGFTPGFTPDEKFKQGLLNLYAISGVMSLLTAFTLLVMYPMDSKKLEELRIKIEAQRAEKAAAEQAARRAARQTKKEEPSEE